MNNSAAKKLSFRVLFSIFVLLATSLAGTRSGAQAATWPQLFSQYCGSGGCNDYQPQCPSNIQYLSTTADSITVSAQQTNGQVCLAASAFQQCLFLVGDAGVTQITFDFVISQQCYAPVQNVAWLGFWMRSQPYSSNAEVDFVESKNGPESNGLNINFDTHGCQVPIYCASPSEPVSTSPGCTPVSCTPSSGNWTGSIVANFSGPANQVQVSVSNSVNGNVGTSTLTGGPTSLAAGVGYYLLMDIFPQPPTTAISPQCTITVSNLQVTGTVPSTIGGAPNCVGLQSASN